MCTQPQQCTVFGPFIAPPDVEAKENMKFFALFFFQLSLFVPLHCFSCTSCSKQCAELRAQITLDPQRRPLRGKPCRCLGTLWTMPSCAGEDGTAGTVQLLLLQALLLSSFALPRYPPPPTHTHPLSSSQSDRADQTSLSGHSPSTGCTGEEKPGGSHQRRDGKERLFRPLLPVFIPRVFFKKKMSCFPDEKRAARRDSLRTRRRISHIHLSYVLIEKNQ